jgi:hypothetical protein
LETYRSALRQIGCPVANAQVISVRAQENLP